MKLIVRNISNITLSESAEIACQFVNSHGLDEIIKDCERSHNKLGTLYAKESSAGTIIYWAKLNKSSLTISVTRDYN